MGWVGGRCAVKGSQQTACLALVAASGAPPTRLMCGWQPCAWPSALCWRMMPATAASAAAPVGGSGPCSSWSIRQYWSCAAGGGRQACAAAGAWSGGLRWGAGAGCTRGAGQQRQRCHRLHSREHSASNPPAAAGPGPQSGAGCAPAPPAARAAAPRRCRGAAQTGAAPAGQRQSAPACGRAPLPCPPPRACLHSAE